MGIAPATAAEIRSEGTPAVPLFYRPELDIIRFFAFLCVFVRHGPGIVPASNAPLWKLRAAQDFHILTDAGAFGLPLFFVLSAYLITGLLLRERDLAGTIHLKAFYARRVLRIWPLYYLGIAIGIANSLLSPHADSFTRNQILYLVFFLGWLGKESYHNGVGVLWSISVEEQFYLIWPALAKIAGRKSVLLGSVATIAIALGTTLFWTSDWYNPLIHFLFFATGALLALALHNRSFSPGALTRLAFAAGGVSVWLLSAEYSGGFHRKLIGLQASLSYSAVALGCLLIFGSLINLPSNWLPQPLVFLGRISYGLYVFHPIGLVLAGRLTRPALISQYQVMQMAQIYIIALTITVAAAVTSYYFFERPFLRLKQRFTLVPSRAV